MNNKNKEYDKQDKYYNANNKNDRYDMQDENHKYLKNAILPFGGAASWGGRM